MPTGDRPRAARRAGEAGYNLVALVMAVTLLNVMIAAALPLWSALIRRDREQETISRGLQYAEAIRVFQRRFGRLPNRLEELVEVEPRSIRRLWKDPLTSDGGWAVLVQLPQGQVVAFDPVTGEPVDPAAEVPLGGDSPGGNRPFTGAPQGGTPQPVLGPIRGVRSRAMGESFQTFAGAESYSGWEFTVDLLIKEASRPGPSGLPRWNALTIGRPFRYPPPGDLGQRPLPGLGPRPGPAAPPTKPGRPIDPGTRSIPAPRPGGRG